MASAWRCLECGAMFAEHFAMCSACFRSGAIVPMAQRLRAATDYQPGVSDARTLARMAWKTVDHPGAYPQLHLGTGALVLVSGAPGSGKSTWASRLLDAVRGPALLVAAEEGISPSLAARLLRSNVKREDFHVLTRATVDTVVGFAREQKLIALAIDSVQEAAWTASELRHVLEVVPSLEVLVGVMQVTKAGAPAGAMALQHEADLHVVVEGMKWSLVKSRYQDLGEAAGEVLPQRREEVADAVA